MQRVARVHQQLAPLTGLRGERCDDARDLFGLEPLAMPTQQRHALEHAGHVAGAVSRRRGDALVLHLDDEQTTVGQRPAELFTSERQQRREIAAPSRVAAQQAVAVRHRLARHRRHVAQPLRRVDGPPQQRFTLRAVDIDQPTPFDVREEHLLQVIGVGAQRREARGQLRAVVGLRVHAHDVGEREGAHQRQRLATRRRALQRTTRARRLEHHDLQRGRRLFEVPARLTRARLPQRALFQRRTRQPAQVAQPGGVAQRRQQPQLDHRVTLLLRQHQRGARFTLRVGGAVLVGVQHRQPLARLHLAEPRAVLGDVEPARFSF